MKKYIEKKTLKEGYHDFEKTDIVCDTICSIIVICPLCSKKERITIPIDIVAKRSNMAVVGITKGKVCDHSFVIYVDKDFSIRGYEKFDLIL